MPSPTSCLVLAADPAPASPGGEGGGGSPLGGLSGFLPIVVIFLIFYLLLIRPQSRERKKREEQIRAVKKHDRVVTNAGLHGTVVALGDSDVVLRLDPDDVRVRVERSALWQIRSRSADEGGGQDESEGAPSSKEKGKTTG